MVNNDGNNAIWWQWRRRGAAAVFLLWAIFAGGEFQTLQGQTLRSLRTATNPATVNLTNFTIGEDRYEFRVHGLGQPPASDTDLISFPGQYPTFRCFLVGGSTRMRCLVNTDDHPNGLLDIDLGTRTDVRVRYQRDLTLKSGTIEIWDGNCTNYKQSIQTLATKAPVNLTGTFNLGGSNLAFGFVRAFSTKDTSGACPLDAPDDVSPRMEFRFENNSLADSSASRSLTPNGATFVDSPKYNPFPQVRSSAFFKQTFRAGVPFTLNASQSAAFTGNGKPVSYTWQQTGDNRPADLQFSNQTGDSITAVAPVKGTYKISLEVKDVEDLTTITQVEVGVVATDDQGVIVQTDKDLDFILDPMTRHGVNPWPWYDITEVADADTLLPPMTAPVTGGNTPLDGTVTISAANNPPQQGLLCCNVLVVGQGTKFTTDLKQGDLIWVWWDRDGDGTYQGRSLQSVGSILSDTQMRLADYYWAPPAALSANMRYSKTGIDASYFTQFFQPSYSWNYYETLLGMYRVYHRTGLASYLTQIRSFCGLWYTYGLDSGYRVTVPRNSGWLSMMACAADFQPGWWDSIAKNVSSTSQSNFNPTVPPKVGSLDLREASYTTRATAMLAKLYPPKTNSPATKRVEWCTYLANQVNNIWISGFQTIGTKYGYWSEDVFAGNLDFPLAPIPPPNGRLGTSPWRSNGLINQALIKVHQVLTDPDSCPNPFMANQVADMIEKSTNFIWDYGRSPDGGVFYNVLYETAQGEDNTRPVAKGTGTINISSGSNIVTGTGTNFTTLFAPCNGSTYIGVRANDEAFRSIYRVVGCPSDTTLLLSTIHGGPTRTGITEYRRANQANVSCGPYSIAPYCEQASYGGRLLTHDIAASFAWMYYRTGDALWRDKLDFFAGRAYGGPATGPGTIGPPAGPQADGNPTNFDQVLNPCGQPPCGSPGRGFGPFSQLSKPFGMSAGAGNAQTIFAYRLGGAQPENLVDVFVSISLPDGATNAKLTVTRPTGVQTVYTCTDSTCKVQIDARLGNHQLKIEYFSSAGDLVGNTDLITLEPPK